MKTFSCKIPSWALSYLINNDSSGLEPNEIDLIHAWEMSWDGPIWISPSTNTYFSNTPEFGLPCDVVECEITLN
jgi:hypothetical protein